VDPSQVELRLAGEFGVARGGTELPDGQIGSRKSRTLLKLLAVERPTLVPVGRIVEVLWDAKPPAAPEQNVATLVSRLRAALGAGVIQGGRQGYRLAVGRGVGVDLDAAAGYCDHAERTVRTAAAVALAAAERALGLLSAGTALAEEPYAAWADPAREELRPAAATGPRWAAAEAALGSGGASTAAKYAEAAMAADPLDETAHRWYMSAAAAAGEQAKALAAYAALSERLGEQLGTDPAPQTRELHLAILREQPVDPAGGGGPAARGRGAARPVAGVAGQRRDGPPAGLRGGDRLPARPGRAQPGPARRGRSPIRRAVHRRAAALPQPARSRLPAADGGHRPGRERR
jgi:DNA-binding SARP family transcriptional activator